MGAYHTLDLELNRRFTLAKQEWDSVALERIGEIRIRCTTAQLLNLVVQIFNILGDFSNFANIIS
jgi:protein pelota